MCITKYVLDTCNYGLKICSIFKINEPWDFVCYSHSECAGDDDTR